MRFNYKESMGFMVSRTSVKMKSHLSKALKPYNVTTEQWALLVRLWEQDGISQKELAEKTLKDQPTVTRIIDKLETRGLIVRQSNPEDRRAFLIFLTEEGHQLRESLERAALEVLDEALRGISEQEQAQLKYLLNKITDNLD